MVPSWSNHCIDYYPLARHGAGFSAERVELVRGSEFFRPTCMTPGVNNTFYLADWVFSAYTIHNRGRLWKLEIDPARASVPLRRDLDQRRKTIRGQQQPQLRLPLLLAS
jgi:hypothetical protein